jgi:type IV secretion system protein VirD4
MTAKTAKTIAAAVVLVIVAAVLLAGANLFAGAALFVSYRQDPTKATFWTIQRAWAEAPDEATRRRVTGAAAFAAFVVLGAPFALAMAYRRRGSDLYGKARFAEARDVEGEGLYAPRGVVLGKHERKLLRLPGYEFILLAAPTRTGKGVGFVVPNLLTFPDSVVTLDIKGENYALTSAFRRQHLENEVIYLNPFGERTHRWNPLSYISQNPNSRVNDLLSLAALLYQDNEKDPFWPASARNAFVGFGLLVLESPGLPKTIGEVLRQASGKGRDVAEYVRFVIDHHTDSGRPLSPSCIDALSRFLNNSETVLKGILATLVAPLAPWANAMVDKATSADDFDLREVRKKKMAIYLHIPADQVVQAGFIVNLFFSQLINENVRELPEHNPELKYQCLLLLDEFTAMGKVPIIAKGVGYMAGYSMRLAIIIQDRSQLESTYGKSDAHNIVSNMGAVVYFTPRTTQESEEYSKMIGDVTETSISQQRSNVGALNVGRYGLSETESYQKRALMLPQELREMGADKQLVARPGIPIIHADKIRYYADDFFLQRFTAVPMQQVRVGSEVRSVPRPLALPKDNWTAYRSQVARSDFYLNTPAAPQEEDPPTDLLLVGINDDTSSDADREAAIAELARRKFLEFTAQFDTVPPATPAEALEYEQLS